MITRVIKDFDCQWYLLICFQFELVFIKRIKVYEAIKVE